VVHYLKKNSFLSPKWTNIYSETRKYISFPWIMF
jgi:hypothetical protein